MKLLSIQYANYSNLKIDNFKLHCTHHGLAKKSYSLRSIATRSIQYVFTHSSTLPLLGVVVVNDWSGQALYIPRDVLLKSKYSKSGKYPKVGKAVSFKAGSTISKWLTIIKLIIKKGD